MGDLHSEDLIQLHDILRGKPACPEQAARGLHTGKHRHAYIPAGKESGRKKRNVRKKGEKDKKKGRARRKRKESLQFLVSLQTGCAAVRQLRDVDGEATISGLVSEAELHLGTSCC